jgi:hypothetical protein
VAGVALAQAATRNITNTTIKNGVIRFIFSSPKVDFAACLTNNKIGILQVYF